MSRDDAHLSGMLVRMPGHSLPGDHDANPMRFLTARRIADSYGLAGDVHATVAERLRAAGLLPVLDVGCGDGALRRALGSETRWLGVDRSPTMLRRAPRPAVRGDACRLPFRDASFGSVAALWMLYHLPDPLEAVGEAHRVLRPGGLFAASTVARDDSPEFGDVLDRRPGSFDAEEAAELVGGVFGGADVTRWDASLLVLPDRAAVVDYLIGRTLERDRAERAAGAFATPMRVTKRGCLVWAMR
jgi:SAM-dependent methyltransferase